VRGVAHYDLWARQSESRHAPASLFSVCFDGPREGRTLKLALVLNAYYWPRMARTGVERIAGSSLQKDAYTRHFLHGER
jgi:hypothetical protein